MIGLKKLAIMMVAALAVVTLGAGTAFANLIINGDFSTGGYPGTGFTSDYLYFAQPVSPATGYTTPKSSLYDEGTFGVGTNPSLYHGSWANFGDHTTGTGNMMIVNGDTQANVDVWASPVPSGSLAVTSGQTYYFGAYLTSVYPETGLGPISPATLAFSINGTQIGSDFTLSANVGTWQLFYVPWVANAAYADISLINRNTAISGNDFALDDISFDTRIPGVPEPGTLILLGSGLLGLAITGARKKFRK